MTLLLNFIGISALFFAVQTYSQEYAFIKPICQVIVIVVICIYSCYLLRLKSQCELSKKRLDNIMTRIDQANRHVFDTQIVGFLENFFEDTPIQNYVGIWTQSGTILRIGDDDVLIDIKMEDFLSNPVESLEQAKMAWMSKKAHQNDLGTQGG